MQKRRLASSAKATGNSDIETRPVYTGGSELSAEQRMLQLKESLSRRIDLLSRHMQTALAAGEKLAKEHENTPVALLSPDSQVLTAANAAHVHAFRAATKALAAMRAQLLQECAALQRDWYQEKTHILTSCQQEPMLSMNWTDIEGLISTPYQRHQAERAFETEEGAVGHGPVSEERRSKLEPKPKAKGRAKKLQPAAAAVEPTPAPVEIEQEPVFF